MAVPNIRHGPSGSAITKWASTVPVSSHGPHGSATMGSVGRIRSPCSWAGLLPSHSTATGPPGGLVASATSVGHPGLPESRHYCWIPGNHTHNSSPRSSSRSTAAIPIPPSSSTISEPAGISRNFKKLNLHHHLGRSKLQSSCGQNTFRQQQTTSFARIFSANHTEIPENQGGISGTRLLS